MQRLVAILDRILTFVVIVLLVAMVFSITGEILLNAAVQPITNWLIHRYSGEGQEPSALARTLESVMAGVATLSSPVNTASQTLLVWLGILGSALAFRLRAHLGVDALVRVYPYRVRLLLDCVSTALIGLFSLAVLLVGGYLLVQDAFATSRKMPGIEWLNQGWFYLALPMAGALNLIYCIHHFLHPVPVGAVSPEGVGPKEGA